MKIEFVSHKKFIETVDGRIQKVPVEQEKLYRELIDRLRGCLLDETPPKFASKAEIESKGMLSDRIQQARQYNDEVRKSIAWLEEKIAGLRGKSGL